MQLRGQFELELQLVDSSVVVEAVGGGGWKHKVERPQTAQQNLEDNELFPLLLLSEYYRFIHQPRARRLTFRLKPCERRLVGLHHVHLLLC